MERVWGKARLFVETISSVRKRQVLSLPIYITNRCTSRCKTCNIWKAKEKEDLDKDVIKNLLSSDEIGKDVEFIITGGDFLLHPEYREIVSMFRGRNLRLFSNGILIDELISLVENEEISSISISLDGRPETNREIRGVDTYKNVGKIVQRLKALTRIEIEYTLSRWNREKDLEFVIDFAKKHKIEMSIGYYSKVEYFGVEEAKVYRIPNLVPTSFTSDYYTLYPLWASGKLKLPCFSTFVRPVIKPNGDVELCEAREVIFGNLYKRSFGEIWRDKKTADIIRSSKKCNRCWLNCQRQVDLAIIYIPRKLGLL